MNLPDIFTRYTRQLMGEELFARLAEGLRAEPPVSIRLNAAKCGTAPHSGERVGWCPTGYYIESRPAFTFDPLLHAGWYYVQEASSMFVHHVVSRFVTSPATALDLCAAPGGKSTALLGALPPGSVLACNEPVRLRAQVLAENMMKWGWPDAVVTCNTPGDYARSGLTFDVVLCDVPCSGEGMFRKDEAAIGEWSQQGVERCAALQREIVAAAWQCLRPGGLLVYSTCTFNAKENEENVAWICRELGAELLDACADAAWNTVGSLSPCVQGPVYRFLPGVARGEGLFMAAMRKCDDGTGRAAGPRRKARKSLRKETGGDIRGWLRPAGDFDVYQLPDRTIATPKRLSPVYEAAAGSLNVLHAGVTLGTAKGRDFIPHQSLALSTALNPDAFPRAELGYAQAIAYLRREPTALPEGTPRGFALVTYGGAPLGFAKNIGTRANNLYPQEWRIRSSHAPAADARPAVVATGQNTTD